MKHLFKVIMIITLVVVLLMINICTVVFASENEDKTEQKSKTKMVEFGLYEEINNTYKVRNTKFEYDKNDTITDILKMVKKDGYIKSYKIRDEQITSITFNDKTNMSAGAFGKKSGFIIVVNDAFVSIKPLEYKLKSGDKINVIYTTDVTTQENKNNLGVSGIKGSQQSLISVWNDELAKVLNSACAKLANSTGNISINALISLGIAKKEVVVSDIIKIANEIEREEHDMDIEYIGELLIASYACGIDPASVNNENYVNNIIEAIKKEDYTQNAKEVVNALMALATVSPRSEELTLAKNTLLNQIKSMQNSDGGFSRKKGMHSDVLSTSQAIIALSSVKNEDGVEVVIDKAIQFSSNNVVKNGVFIAENINSATKVSTMITALSSANISVKDSRFSVTDQNLMDQLLEFYLQDGSFSERIGETYNEMATSSAVIALIATKKGKNPYEDMVYYKRINVNHYDAKEVKKSIWTCIKQDVVMFTKDNIRVILMSLVAIFLMCIALIIMVKSKKNSENKGE